MQAMRWALLFAFASAGREHAGEDRDDGDDNQQFDEREGSRGGGCRIMNEDFCADITPDCRGKSAARRSGTISSFRILSAQTGGVPRIGFQQGLDHFRSRPQPKASRIQRGGDPKNFFGSEGEFVLAIEASRASELEPAT